MGPAIPDGHHVARYCKPSTFDEDLNPTFAAFLLRVNETYLSVDWLESFSGAEGHAARVAALRAEVAALGHMKPAKTGKYAVLNVGATRALVRQRTPDQRLVRITQEADGFPAFHAGIHDTANDEMLCAEAIAESVVAYEAAV
jgi:hypothetical protein